MDSVLTEFEHCFRVFATSFLFTPGGSVSEVKRTTGAACVVLLEIVAVFNIVPRPYFGHQRETAYIVILDCFPVPEVCPSVSTDFLWLWVVVVANCDIDDDVARVVSGIDALVDGTIYVDVPDCASVGEDMAIPQSWWKDKRN